MRGRPLVIVVLALGLASGWAQLASADTSARIAVVVGRESPLRSVTLDSLREVYLHRQRLWPNGERAMPVNLPADSATRRAFSRHVLGRLPADLVSYWRRRYFEGIRPPLVLRTPEAVCAYVAAEPAAIGYMRAADVDHDTCRTLLMLEHDGR